MIAKYVIIRHRGEELPLVWPNLGTMSHTLEHKEVAALGISPADVVSAGSCIPCDGWRCFGESLSLRMKSRGPADTAVMLRHFATAHAFKRHEEHAAPVCSYAALVAPLKSTGTG